MGCGNGCINIYRQSGSLKVAVEAFGKRSRSASFEGQPRVNLGCIVCFSSAAVLWFHPLKGKSGDCLQITWLTRSKSSLKTLPMEPMIQGCRQLCKLAGC